jgi:DNA-binding transcriptional regulator YbjK
MHATESRHESKTRLLQAALAVIRAKGYTATRIEDVCEAAGLTKGSFFHHFSTKEDLAITTRPSTRWNACLLMSIFERRFSRANCQSLPAWWVR